MSTVILDGHEIRTQGPVIGQRITPFGAVLGSGSQKRTDFALADLYPFENFGGGIGVARVQDEGQRDRYADADGVSAVKGTELLLETGTAASAVVGSSATPVQGIIFGGSLYAAADDKKVYKWSGSAWGTAVYTAANAITDMIVFNQAGTDYLLVAFGTNYAYSSNGSSWTTQSAAVPIDYMTIFDGKLVALSVNSTTRVVQSTATPAQATPGFGNNATVVQGTSRGIVVFRDQDGAPSVWYATSVGLFQIDWTNSKSYLVYDWRSTPFDNNGKSLVEFNGNLIFPLGEELLQISPQGNVVSIGFDRADGLINADHGTYIARIVKLQNFLLVLNRSSSLAAVMIWQGSGWHPQLTGLSASDFLLHEVDTGTQPRLWAGNGTAAPVYQEFNDQSERKLPWTGQVFVASGTWTSYWTDFGFPEFPKKLLSVTVKGRDFSDTAYVAVEYAIDDSELAASWRPLGNTRGETSRKELPFNGGKGLACTTMRLRLTLYRSSSDTGETPIVEAIIVKLLKTPKTRYAWLVTVPIQDKSVGEFDAETVLEWIKGLPDRAAKESLEFWPTGNRRFAPELVDISAGPTFSVEATPESGNTTGALSGTAQFTLATPT